MLYLGNKNPSGLLKQRFVIPVRVDSLELSGQSVVFTHHQSVRNGQLRVLLCPDVTFIATLLHFSPSLGYCHHRIYQRSNMSYPSSSVVSATFLSLPLTPSFLIGRSDLISPTSWWPHHFRTPLIHPASAYFRSTLSMQRDETSYTFTSVAQRRRYVISNLFGVSHSALVIPTDLAADECHARLIVLLVDRIICRDSNGKAIRMELVGR